MALSTAVGIVLLFLGCALPYGHEEYVTRLCLPGTLLTCVNLFFTVLSTGGGCSPVS